MRGKDLLSIGDLDAGEVVRVVDRGLEMRDRSPGPLLAGKAVALLFEKPSLRTRASFDMAVHQLGGYSFYLGPAEVGLGSREPASDVARVLSRYVDCIVARVFSHSALVELGEHASIPVVNALSDLEHPCQTLADLVTIQQHKGGLKGLSIAYVGDGNNVARSLCLGAASVGAGFTIATPLGYGLDPETLQAAQERLGGQPAALTVLKDPKKAVHDADVVYTDVWTSMGQEEETEKRRRDFAGYTVDADLLARAKPGALLMHPMPAHYGEEVPPGMLDHPQSVAYDQAENRLHAQKALLAHIMGSR